MGKEYRTRIFKSGNSLAVRLPKELGIEEGEHVVLSPHADGSFSFWRESDGLKVLMGLYGAFSEDFMSEGRGDTEQEDYGWDDGQRGTAA